MARKITGKIAIVLALVMLLTSAVCAVPVHAASKADMEKANVKWDLKNNKTLKYKTEWSILGTKQHTVKMTNFKVSNAKKKGYKQCTFTLTFRRKISPTKAQIKKMAGLADEINLDGIETDNGPFGGGFYFTVVDYKTGKSLEAKNDKKVKVTSYGWKYSNYEKKTGRNGMWIKYPKKATVKIKIVYPKSYKNLAVGVGGYSAAPESYIEMSSGGSNGVGVASVGGGVTTVSAKRFWSGKKAFSKETCLYSKKDKKYAHFMRIK